MKRVGIITNLMTGYGGVQTCVLSLIKGLNQNQIIPDIISDKEPNSNLWLEQNLEAKVNIVNYSISVTTFRKYRKYLQPIWEFVFYLKTSWIRKEYDFIFIFQPNVLVDTNQKHLFYLSMSPRAKSFTNTPWLSNLKDKVYKLFIKQWHPIFEFQNYNCVINSHFTANYFEEYFKKKIEVIYPSNLIKEQDIVVPFDKDPKSVLFLSRIAPYKRPELVLNLAKENPEYKFYIIGGLAESHRTFYNTLLTEIEDKQLNNVTILVNQPHDITLNFLRKSEYFFFGAKNEHFGITTVEALLFGAIPFVHDSGGQREIVPFDILRFSDEEMAIKFAELINLNISQKALLVQKLMDHSKKFTESVFIEKMLEKMNNE